MHRMRELPVLLCLYPRAQKQFAELLHQARADHQVAVAQRDELIAQVESLKGQYKATFEASVQESTAVTDAVASQVAAAWKDKLRTMSEEHSRAQWIQFQAQTRARPSTS